MRYLMSLAGVVLLTLLGLTRLAQPSDAAVTEGLYGYVVTGSTYTSTTADWIMATLPCTTATSGTFISLWTGLDGYSSPTTEQIGVTAECTAGKTTYTGFYDLYPDATVYFAVAIKPGDQLDASVAYSGSSFTLKLSDVTQGWTQTVVKSLAGADRSSAETFVAAPSNLSCSPTVTLAAFTGDTVDGKALGSLSPTKVTGTDPHIIVSAASGAGFSVTCT
jgi:Peptidase A4 family